MAFFAHIIYIYKQQRFRAVHFTVLPEILKKGEITVYDIA